MKGLILTLNAMLIVLATAVLLCVVWGIAAKAMKYCPNCAAKMTNTPIWQQEQEDKNGREMETL